MLLADFLAIFKSSVLRCYDKLSVYMILHQFEGHKNIIRLRAILHSALSESFVWQYVSELQRKNTFHYTAIARTIKSWLQRFIFMWQSDINETHR